MPTQRVLPYDETVFEPVPRTRADKIRCKTCHASGHKNVSWNYGTTDVVSPDWWGYAHERGHGWKCSKCDIAFTSSHGLYMHQRRKHR